MAKKETQSQETNFFPIEQLKENDRTPEAVYQGMCAANGWKKGRMAGREEYQEAKRRFLGTAIGGSRK